MLARAILGRVVCALEDGYAAQGAVSLVYEVDGFAVLLGDGDGLSIFRRFLTVGLFLGDEDYGLDSRAQDFAYVERMRAMGHIFIFIWACVSPGQPPGSNSQREGCVFNLSLRVTRVRQGLALYFQLERFNDRVCYRAAVFKGGLSIDIRGLVYFRVYFVRFFHVLAFYIGIRYDRGLFRLVRLFILFLHQF